MVTDKDEIKNNFKNFIEKHDNGNFSGWYSGITNDLKKRLADHKVENGYISDDAGTKENAENVEDYLTKKLETKGGSGGGTTDSTLVYSYKIRDYTNEDI